MRANRFERLSERVGELFGRGVNRVTSCSRTRPTISGFALGRIPQEVEAARSGPRCSLQPEETEHKAGLEAYRIKRGANGFQINIDAGRERQQAFDERRPSSFPRCE